MSSAPERPASPPINPWIYLGIPAVTAIVLVLLELTSLDMDIAKLAYDPAAGEFIGRHSFFLEDRAETLEARTRVHGAVHGVVDQLRHAGQSRDVGAVPLEPEGIRRSGDLQRIAQPPPSNRQTRTLLARRSRRHRLHVIRSVFRIPRPQAASRQSRTDLRGGAGHRVFHRTHAAGRPLLLPQHLDGSVLLAALSGGLLRRAVPTGKEEGPGALGNDRSGSVGVTGQFVGAGLLAKSFRQPTPS
nr:hypothetical protein [Tanacetum cinerariifolium]